MPGPLAVTGWKSYPGMLMTLGRKGYIALAYTERGLPGSTGEGDVAGAADRADGSKVITWVLENYPQADPNRIGFVGTSYGAGQSLLIAAHDERVKAVCALSAWADLWLSLYENQTPHLRAVNALADVFKGRLSEEAGQILEDFKADRNLDKVQSFCRDRSPMTYLEKLKIPIFLGTYWHETIFSVPAVVSFFNALTGPKRLLVQTGDHSSGEIGGFLGLMSRPTDLAYQWLDRFVKGDDIDIDLDNNVHAEFMHVPLPDVVPSQKRPSWESYVLPTVRYYLDAPAPGSQDGSLLSAPGPGGVQEFMAGADTAATVAPKLVFTGIWERLGSPVRYATATISREHAAVWSTPPFTTEQRITGSLTLHVTVTPSASTATLVAHLFELDPKTGQARIITSAPFTLTSVEPNQTRPVIIPLQPTDYRVRPGHQLQLVVDTKDPLYTDRSVPGTKIQISTRDGGSYLELPIREA